MRNREEIIKSTTAHTINVSILEVLLDIRDLLNKNDPPTPTTL